MVESKAHYFFNQASTEGYNIKKVVYSSGQVGDAQVLPGVFNSQEKEYLEALARRFPLGAENLKKRYRKR